MLKTIIILSALLVCCYCEDNSLIDEARAKKKKSMARLWVMIILFIFSKVAVLKVVSAFLFMAFFQKFCYIIGLVISSFMKNREAMKPAPSTLYGPPADYNTIGYSYGPPESEPFTNPEHSGTGFPDLGNFNWPFKRN
ncbi:uncharacterized protein LOC125225504 [Leguminivora glycinivorella]|uniref:uncharacterized protein LOC125225504 n=1 Tax=Leguminivora glycinivorella TaxID=1035111 RepID=UPI00200C5F76|nr:uncharacterized protein LOC125225504 [Leguminivora glycinivorella]